MVCTDQKVLRHWPCRVSGDDCLVLIENGPIVLLLRLFTCTNGTNKLEVLLHNGRPVDDLIY